MTDTSSGAQNLRTFIITNVTSIVLHNAHRDEEGKDLALVVYAIAGLTHILMSLLVALCIAWRVPESVLSLMPYAKDVRVATFYWWYAWLSMTFLISCAGGTVTMLAVLVVYAIIVLYILFDALCFCRVRCTERNRPADAGGRSLQAAQRIHWLMNGGNASGGTETSKHSDDAGADLAAERLLASSSKNVSSITSVSFADMDQLSIFEALPENPFRLPPKEQKQAFEKVNSVLKLAREGTDDKKKPWSYYPDKNPDGSPSDHQIALEEAAAWKVRKAFKDQTEMTENGQIRDADSGVIVGSKMETAIRLARMLMRYSPGSLSNIEHILESFRLQEDRLFADLEKRYGPEPSRLERKRWLGAQRARGGMTADEIAQSFSIPELPPDLYWTRCPVRPVAPQLAAMVLCSIFILLCGGGIFVAVVYWPIPEYRYVEDVLRTGAYPHSTDPADYIMLSQPEKKPDLTAKGEYLLYGWPGTATEMRVHQYLDIVAKYWYPYIFYQYLEPDERYNHIQEAWIDAYNVPMLEYVNQTYNEYETVDKWYSGRILRAGTRTLAPRWNTTGVILCPVDGRYTAYSNLQRARKFWVKGGRFTYEELIGDKDVYMPIEGNSYYFSGGTIVLGRLATADYHHFHAPVSGKIISITEIVKHHNSNTPTAIHSGNNALYNTRWVVLIDTAVDVEGIRNAEPSRNNRSPTNMGVVAYVIIGATYAGSVALQQRNFSTEGYSRALDSLSYTSLNPNMTQPIPMMNQTNSTALHVGMMIKSGQELGQFHLGGSTIVMIFRSGAASFLCRVLDRSADGVESKFNVGAQIGANRGTIDGDGANLCI